MDKKILDVRLKSWMPIFEEQARSGLTKKAFCEQNNIKRGDFFYWQRMAREYLLEQRGIPLPAKNHSSKREPVQDFYEIAIPDNAANPPAEVLAEPYEPVIQMPSSISISYGGFTIEMNGEVNGPALCAILKAVKNAN